MALDYRTYAEAKEKFQWRERWELFDGTKDRFNVAHECVDRHDPNETALRLKFVADRRSEIYTFGQLSRLTSQFANLLERLGIGFGERVAVLLYPSLEFYVAMFGTFKRGAVFVPLFPLFGPDAVAYRLEDARPAAVVTTREGAAVIGPELAERLRLKFIYAEELQSLLKREEASYAPRTTVEDLCMIQYSSGTTGAPKALKYAHGAISVAAVVMKFGWGLKPHDIYFCPSSPAWGHGIWYGTIGPLTFGRAVGTLSGRFDPEVCLEALEEFGVTNMSAIPSHYRLMLETGRADKYALKLRLISYTGEAMPKHVLSQLMDTWGLVPYTGYGTTEVGPITLDYGGFEDWVVKPGSLGKPMIGGARVAVLDEEGNELPAGQVGQIAVWRKDRWVRVGDSAYVDEDGYFWYVGRMDDVIISSGYTIGPIEVEQTLARHPAVAECAVVGSPDRERGEIVKAFVKLKEGFSPSDELARQIQEFVKDKLSKHEYPRELEFVEELPKTPDGKIRRKVLKERERQRKLGVAGTTDQSSRAQEGAGTCGTRRS